MAPAFKGRFHARADLNRAWRPRHAGHDGLHGLLEIAKPAAGETVVVAAASGAVGSVVGQIARIKGARAVGIAGGPVKCKYVTEELGFDACIDHRASDFATRLGAACPKGVDVYFENV